MLYAPLEERTLAACLHSFLAQTRLPEEIIVVNTAASMRREPSPHLFRRRRRRSVTALIEQAADLQPHGCELRAV